MNVRRDFNCKRMAVVIKHQLVQRKSMALLIGSLANLTTKYLQSDIRSRMFIIAEISPTVGHDPGCSFHFQF